MEEEKKEEEKTEKKEENTFEFKIQLSSSNCSANNQIYNDIRSFLNKQHNHIPISLLNTKDEEKIGDSLTLSLKVSSGKTKDISLIKGTKLYYIYNRNGECARWV
jgi:hypothetical protein